MKFKDFFKKFKTKDKRRDSISTQCEQSNFSQVQPIEIEVSQEDNYWKVTIADYYKIQDYVKGMSEVDSFDVCSQLNNSVTWNNRRQRVNKGTYYVFKHNDRLYNVLVNDEMICIDERTPVEDEILNKVIRFYCDGRPYDYFRCMHDRNGSSYDTRYYGLEGALILELELSKAEFLIDFNNIVSSLSSFKGIENIIDLNEINNIVSQSLEEDILGT